MLLLVCATGAGASVAKYSFIVSNYSSWSRLRWSPGIKHFFVTFLLKCYLSPYRLSATVSNSGWGSGVLFGPCGSFRGSVGVSAHPGPAESWEDVQTSSLLNGVSKRGVSGLIMMVHSVGQRQLAP